MGQTLSNSSVFSLRRALALWGLALLALSGCSDETGSSTSTSGGGVEKCLATSASGGSVSIDCYAKAELRRVTTNQLLTGAAGERTEVQAGLVAIGTSLDVDFRLGNTANPASAAPLRIDEVRLTYTAKSPLETASDPAFSCWNGTGDKKCSEMKGIWHKVVPAGFEDSAKNYSTQETFRIRYKHFDTVGRSAKVCLKLGGDKLLASKELCYEIYTTTGKPKLLVQPAQIEFPYVQIGKMDTRDLSLVNNGDATLYVSKIDLALAPAFSLVIKDQTYKPGAPVVFDPPLELAPNKSLAGQLQFKPTDDKKRDGEIRIFSNDAAIKGGLPVLVTANSKVPCIEVKPAPVVNFGVAQLGKVSTLNLTVSNCGTEKLTISKLAIKPGGSDAYSLDFAAKAAPSETAPWVLGTNESLEIPALYTPPTLSPLDPATQTPLPDLAQLEVASNAAPVSLKLTGVCMAKTCPEAKISVTEGEQVVPQTVLHLSGAQSIAPGGGSITKWLWKVQKQPEGSKQAFVPGASFPSPTFTANAAGEYVLCLDVWDDQNPPQQSCTPACVTVLAVPSEALHIELLWKTPADKDETDKGQGVGADMDLHFADALAQGPDQDCDGAADPWFSQPFDVFWFNPTPKWGSAATLDDDARLDLDDTDGAGPENVNLDSPQGSATEAAQYAVGVHYWNDHGFGKSYATARIYVLGKQVVEIKDIALNPVDMWFVGKINWPNEAMGGTGPVLEQCLQSGDACLAKKNPADPKGGAMWQASGTPCIKPCYISPLANSNSAVCSLPK